MAVEDIRYEDLAAARETMIDILLRDLTQAEKGFLVSLKEGRPNWDLLELKGIERLPAIQ